MAGTITSLQIQKRNKERVNVFIDDEYALAVTLTVAAGLRKGQYLSDTEIEQLKQGDERDKAYNKAIRFLSFRPRSQAEVEQRLRKKGYADGIVADVMQRLGEQNYLNDEDFVRFWLENRAEFKPRGERALRYELRQKGIETKVIDAVLGDLDEEVLAWAAVERKLQQWQHLPQDIFKKKLMGFLSRRGFGYEIVQHVWQRVQDTRDTSDDLSDWE